MTEAELERRVKERLNEAELLVHLDGSGSQFLEVPGPFVELVMNDGSKLPQARQVVDALRVEFREQDLELDAVVRALWQIASVNYVGQCRSESGSIRTAECYSVSLACGLGRKVVTVEVGYGAIETVRATLGSKWPSEVTASNEAMERMVRAFVQEHLDQGGTSYWDPERNAILQMNAATLQHVWACSAA